MGGGDWTRSSEEGHQQSCLWTQVHSPLRFGMLFFSFYLQTTLISCNMFERSTLTLYLIFRNYPSITTQRLCVSLCH